MKIKKIPMRTCVITKEKCEKKELIRVVRTPEGKVIVDETGRANGRGAYLKRSKEVFDKARKTRVLDKILEINTTDELYNTLDELLDRKD